MRILGILVFGLLFTGPALAADAGPGKTAVERSCGRCHRMGEICPHLGKGQPWWEGTIQRMVLYGTKLNPAQVTEAAQYLSGLNKNGTEFCQ